MENSNQPVLIMAGTSTQYTETRRKLELLPKETRWLTRPTGLDGLAKPKVYRVGSWKDLAQVEGLEVALRAVQAEIIDL